MDYYSAIKGKLLIHATTKMDLKINMLSERIQIKKHTDSIYIKFKKIKTNLVSILLGCCDKLPQIWWLKRTNFLPQFCRSEVQSKVLVELDPSVGSEEESTLCLLPSFWWLPVILGNCWLIDSSLQFLPPLYHLLSVSFFLFLIRTLG